VYDNAFPILQKYGFSATVFVVTDYIGKASDWDYKKMQHLNWQQLRELADYGIEIGSHGAGHIDLRSLSDEKLEYEIAGSKKMLEDKLGIPVKYFSYPFGRYDKRIIDKVMKAGYEKACALSSGGGEFAVARQGVYLYDTPYSVYLKIERQSWLEQCKDYVNNMLAGGTITYRKLFPVKSRG
jgi:peptidoglycan/xylan/chitin deacetylase (PgdA/CDA1 family)